MTSSVDETATSQPEDDDFVWRLSKETLDGKVTLTLGEQFADLPDAHLTFFMHKLGESLIKIGTQFIQSRISDDDDDEDDDY